MKTQALRNDARAWIRALLPAAAAVLAFALAFAVGMTAKSSPTPGASTSLAPPVAIRAPRASVPALESEVPTPGLRARPKPATRPKTSPAPASPGVASSVTSRSTVATQIPPPPVANTPPSGVVHGSGGGGSSAGGNGVIGVVHGGN